MVSPFPTENWKRIRCVLSAFLSSWKPPIAFDAIDNQPVDLLFALLVPADQTKTHLHTLSLGGQTAGGQSDLSSPARGAER